MTTITRHKDPEVVLHRKQVIKQFMAAGCGACAGHQLASSETEFVCIWAVPHYPNATNKRGEADYCGRWTIKKRGKRQ